VSETIPLKDIAIAVMGTAGAIASLLLVLIGFLAAKAETITVKTRQDKYKLVAKIGLAPFFAQTAIIFTSYLWMLKPTSSLLLQSWTWGFGFAMVVFVAYAIIATLMM
jgi:hypothetical protein